MLVQNKPEEGLQPHQLAAYRAARRGIKEKGKASVIMPTGCGKSFVALQMMLDYKNDNILITVPTIVIKNQYYEYIAKYIVGEEPTLQRTARMISEEFFPHLKISTYMAIERSSPELIKKLKPKLAITDEAHRSVAEQTEKKMQILFDSNPETYWLGITATPERMDGKNVVDHFYEGTIDYELTLIEALRERIVKAPHYVPCAYALSDKLEDVKKAIDECTDVKKKARLEEIYEQLRNIVANAKGIPELIANNIQVKDGKVVVFCRSKEHMDEVMSKAQEWFGQIDTEPEIYSVYSGEGYTQVGNAETIKTFKNSTSKHLKILYTVDMINEGFHIPVDTLIMARPTKSRNIYDQQLGRGLSSDPYADPTTVFDLVNNYLNFDIDREINEIMASRSSSKEDFDSDNTDDIEEYEEYEENEDKYIPIDNFKVTGEIRDFVNFLEEANMLDDENRYVRFAEEIHEWVMAHKKFPSSSFYGTKEERDLNSKYFRLKLRYIDKYLSLETAEERQAFENENPHIEYVIGLVEEASRFDIPTHLKNAIGILDWMKAHKYPITPRAKSTDLVEASLGHAYQNMKQFVKIYLRSETDEEKRIFEQKYPEIFKVMDKLEEIKELNTPGPIIQASQLREWIESQPEPRKPTTSKPEEYKMARTFNSLKTFYVSKYKDLPTDEERQAFLGKYPFVIELVGIIDDIDAMCTKKNIALQNAEDIKAWIIENRTERRPSTTSKNPREVQLAEAYSTIVKKIRKYESITDEKEKREYEYGHPEIFEMIEIVEWIDENTCSESLVNARRIRDWMEEHQRFPLRQLTHDSKFREGYYESEEMQTEHARRVSLNTLRSGILKKFISVPADEREAYIKEHKDIDKVLAIVNDLDLRFGSKKQRALAELIHQDRDLHERLEAALALEKEYQARVKKENEQQKSEQGVDIDGE